MSERRACRVFGADRTLVRYRSRRPRQTSELRARLRELAGEQRRFGYRRLHVLLRHEGRACEPQEDPAALTARRACRCAGDAGRKRATGTRAPLLSGGAERALVGRLRPRPVRLGAGGFRIFNVIDDVTKECLAAVVDTSISGRRVARELAAVIARRGRPGLIVTDHGTEFTSNAMLAWTRGAGVAPGTSSPRASRCRTASAKPSIPMRDELLNETLFFGLDHARSVIAQWVADYNRRGRTRPSAT